ncbi:MAG: WD40/YVTN/BNR-like repeat-containing protein [Gemmatimonadota bacterium]
MSEHARVMLLVGTKRGLFSFTSDTARRAWRASGPHLVGREVYHAVMNPRDRVIWAATDHAVWGAHLHTSADLGESWQLIESAPHYSDERGLAAIWFVAPVGATVYAGIEPAGLFVSHDRGESWRGVDALNQHTTTSTWQPAGGGLALHSIIPDTNAQRIFCAVSAGGVYRSDDAGASWRPLNQNVRADFQPEQYPIAGQCVHKLLQHPLRPQRLYQQNHCGTYRSDDAGESWIEITNGLPSDFGYALAIDAHGPDTLFVIPEESSHMRSTVEGRLRVYCSRDAGASWQPLTHGLPQENAYVSILREGMTADTLDPCGVYFGTSSGHLFASPDRGESWTMIAGFLPRILSVTVADVEE